MPDFVGISLRHSDQLSEQECAVLVASVREQLPSDTTFDLELRSDSLDGIDFRWHQNGAPSTQGNATILCLKRSPSHLIALGMTCGGTYTNRPTAALYLNWIGHHDSTKDYGTPPDFTERILFHVHDCWQGACDEYVYHYTRWEIARDFILGGGRQLMANPITRMGDPLEFEDIIVPLYGGVDGDNKLPLRIWDALKTSCRHGIKLLCVSLDQKAVIQQHRKGQLIRRTALRGFAHPSMWHHYGADHEGVCVILNKATLDNSINSIIDAPDRFFRGNVTYQRKNQIFRAGQSIGIEHSKMTDTELASWAREKMFEHRKMLFFTKHTDWEPECEYRWLISSETDDPVFIPIQNALVGVVVGSDFDADNHRQIEQLAKAVDIPVRRIWWRNGEAVSPSGLEAFEPGQTLETWETRAAARRDRRKNK